MQAITGPGRTGLGVSVQFMLDALRQHAPDVGIAGLYPNENNAPLSNVPSRIAWEQWRLPRAVNVEHRRQKLSLLHSPALGAPYHCPLPVVAHVHDLIPVFYPQLFSGWARWYWSKLLPLTWRRCRALTVSNAAVASDLANHLDIPRDRINVVPYYPDPAVVRAAEKVRQEPPPVPSSEAESLPMFVTLASHEPRKNIELCIEALGRLKRDNIHARLTCIGTHTPHTKTLRQLAWDWHLSERVEFPGYLTREDAVSQLLSSTALIFASRYEGFGMPPLEAQSIGVATVISNIPCHRAVYADRSRWQQVPEELRDPPPIVNPDDVEGLANIMLKLIEDHAYLHRLQQAGLSYSATFSPEATAAALVAAYRQAIS